MAPLTDPVHARRARFARASRIGQRVGYACFALAVAAFFVGLATSYSTAVVALVVAALIAGSLTLLPGIVLGYAVKAAERDEREGGS